MKFLLLPLFLLAIEPASAQGLAAVAAVDAVPPVLSGIISLLWNALGLTGGTAGAGIAAGILWRVWSLVKAKASQADASTEMSKLDKLRAFIQDSVFAHIGSNPPASGQRPSIDAPAMAGIVADVKNLLGTGAPDSDVIRSLAKAALGRILTKQ